MNVIEKIKLSIGRMLLSKDLVMHKKSGTLPAFATITDVGIVYNANDQNNEEKINQFASWLREQGKRVFMLGYVNAKTLPHTKTFHITSEYFWNEKLTTFMLPDKVKIGRFLETPFDLLMNLYYEDELPMQAISAYSQASYRIGAKIPHALGVNDALIDMPGNTDVLNLARQMVHYLNVINRKQ